MNNKLNKFFKNLSTTINPRKQLLPWALVMVLCISLLGCGKSVASTQPDQATAQFVLEVEDATDTVNQDYPGTNDPANSAPTDLDQTTESQTAESLTDSAKEADSQAEQAQSPESQEDSATLDAGQAQSGVEQSQTDKASSTTSNSPTKADKSSSASTSKSSDATDASNSTKSTTAPQIDEDGTYTTKEDVALYIHVYDKLPDNFITKKEAKKLGWTGGSLEEYAPGMCIGGDYFGNYEGLLPEDQEYHECDIDTLGKKKRGAKRIIYSEDGYIYYTPDHYESFELMYEP